MSSFLTSMADKAQSAISSSALADYIPPSVANALGSNKDGGASGSGRHYAFESLHHSLRSLQVQYGSALTEEIKLLQLMVTAQKGVALDYESVSRDAKTATKQLYDWGQKERADIKDVTDRLAYVNFMHGTLSSTLSTSLETARAPLKAVRDAEQNMYPRRNLRKGVYMQIQQVKTESKSAQAEKRAAELTEQLRRMEQEDAMAERELEMLKRNALREAESKKWAALREYGEKLVLLSQASEGLLAALPSDPPTEKVPYTGATATASIRAGLQRALDNYKTGHVNLPPSVDVSSDSETRSFGETHASELSSIASASTAALSETERAAGTASPTLPATATSPRQSVPPLDPATLNHSPVHLADVAPPPAAPAVAVSPTPGGPTVVETGVPLSAGPGGPGPASGSLAGGHVTEEVPGFSVGGTLPVRAYETAEEEKKRLEREERERILAQGGSHPDAPQGEAEESFPDASSKDDGGPPPYQEF